MKIKLIKNSNLIKKILMNNLKIKLTNLKDITLNQEKFNSLFQKLIFENEFR